MHFGVTPYEPIETEADNVLYQGSNKSFILYKDDFIDTEHNYTNTNNSCGGETSCLEMLYIKSSDYISRIGVQISGGNDVKYLGGENPSGVSIFFKRPSPEPYIYVLGNNNKYWGIVSGAGKPQKDYVKIEISSLKDPDSKKYITISNTGQISVSNQDDKKYKNKEKGFTLIELMVATSIFSMVMLASLGALFTLLGASKNSRATHTAMVMLILL